MAYTDGRTPPSPVPGWIPPVTISRRREDGVHLLLWQVHGRAELWVDGQDLMLRTDQAQWIPAGREHGFTVREGSVTVPLIFPVGQVATVLDAPTTLEIDRGMHPLLLAHAVATSTIVQPPVDLARQILTRIEGRTDPASPLPLPAGGPARAVAETLLLNPGDGRDIEALAESVHTSVRTLERSFRHHVGMTLREWRIRHRVETAATLLRSGAALPAVAQRVGYQNVNAFRRVFTGRMGVSPTVYAQRHSGR